MEVEEGCMSMEDKSFEERSKIVTKLHRQFAHPSAKNLKALLKNAEHLDDEISQIVDNISAECETCKRYKTPQNQSYHCHYQQGSMKLSQWI